MQPSIKQRRPSTDTSLVPTDALRYIRLRWPGTCSGCKRALGKGAWAFHDAASRSVSCSGCVTREANAPLGISKAPPKAIPRSEPLDYGTPGAGARRRYEHLREQREKRARERYGRLGVVAVRVSGDPQHIKAWKTGADGERRVAARLEKLLDGKGVFLLHDRRIPMSLANIDHLAVGPGGVTVIDAKNIRGRVRIQRTGGLFTPRLEALRVAGRDRTKLVESVECQMAEVRATLSDLGHPQVSVAGALCLVNVDGLPLFGTLALREVKVLAPRSTARLAARAGSISSDELAAIRDGLARRLPAA